MDFALRDSLIAKMAEEDAERGKVDTAWGQGPGRR
jgi:hypothetical protein